MVRVIYFLKQERRIRSSLSKARSELDLFQDPEDDILKFLAERQDISLLILGHTHQPEYRAIFDKTFINTGTWTKMHELDFGRRREGLALTYAKIDLLNTKDLKIGDNSVEHGLFVWRGRNRSPFLEFQ